MKVGIIGAMEVEVELLKGSLEGAEARERAGMEFFSGELGGTQAVVVRCGIGKVNAAMCVQALADLFGVTHVVNTGVAGSLDARIDVGGLVVSTDCLWHDFDLTPLGYPAGQVPGVGTLAFPADEGLRACAVQAALAEAPEVGVWEGRVVSGDQFIADAASKERLGGLGGMCCEMEGAAVAQASYLNGLPFVVVRAISDKPGSRDQVMDYAAFEEASAHRCARIVARMCAEGLR